MAFTLTEKNTKTKNLRASTKAWKFCNKLADNTMSFETLHKISNRATPCKMLKYKLALCLFKLYNLEFNLIKFCLLNYNQILTSRQRNFITLKSNKTKVGLNSLTNRLYSINGLIPPNG